MPISPQVDFTYAIGFFIYAIVGEGVFLLGPVYFAKRYSSGDIRSILKNLGFRRFNVRRVLPWLIVLFLAFFLINYLYQLLITTFHLSLQTNDQRVLESGKVTPISVYATLIAAVVIAPLCEEVFFRSFAFMGFLRSMPLWLAIVLNAFIFALIHLDPASFAVLFCIGLALAFLRWYFNFYLARYHFTYVEQCNECHCNCSNLAQYYKNVICTDLLYHILLFFYPANEATSLCELQLGLLLSRLSGLSGVIYVLSYLYPVE